jgi:hypothetical protein
MSGKLIGYLSLFIFSMPLYAESYQEQDDDEYLEENSEDIWFGPGYYYGVWFNNEDDYQGWRRDHEEYPPNHDYYSPDHPIEYSPNGDEHHEGGHGGGRR